MRKLTIILSIIVILTVVIVIFTSKEDGITKINVETLQNRLENEEITLLDVRESD